MTGYALNLPTASQEGYDIPTYPPWLSPPQSDKLRTKASNHLLNITINFDPCSNRSRSDSNGKLRWSKTNGISTVSEREILRLLTGCNLSPLGYSALIQIKTISINLA